MKKSEILRKAQISVLGDFNLSGEEKLEIVKMLMSEENYARWTEEQEVKAVEAV